MTLRLSPETTPWLSDPAVRRVLDAFAPEDCPRFVGGCVRNALIGGGSTDLDIAVLCRPEETLARLEAAGLKAIPTAVDHGTVMTVSEPESGNGEPIEITTLRQDVETDGRHAVVAFTKDWAVDAARRDFTMNALYAAPDGEVFDPLGEGVEDLKARRVRFIGRAEERIQEDYLRILRFFRFFAWYGVAAPAPEDLAAIRSLKDGVTQLARERIGHETRKLLAAPNPSASLALMRETQADEPLYSGPVQGNEDAWSALVAMETALDAPKSWLRRLLFAFDDRRAALKDLLRLSKAEATAVERRAHAEATPLEEAGYRYGFDAALDAAILSALRENQPPDPQLVSKLKTAANHSFPLTAQDLMASGVKPGPQLGEQLKAAENRWIASGFALSRDDLLKAAL